MPTLQRAGSRIAWDTQGAGSPVLLIHGLSSSGANWHRVVPRIATQHQVITVDNRGTGSSDAPRGRYSFTTMARDALAVLDAAGVSQAHVLGISMGSCIAQEMAVLAPERLTSMVLASSNPGTRHSILPSRAVLRKLLSGVIRDYETVMRALIPYTYHPKTDRERIEEDMAVALAQPPSRRGFAGQVLGSLGWDRYRMLPDVRIPTLVLHGAEDLLDPVVNAERLADRIPGATLLVLENASHQVFTDQQDAALDAVTGFFSASQ